MVTTQSRLSGCASGDRRGWAARHGDGTVEGNPAMVAAMDAMRVDPHTLEWREYVDKHGNVLQHAPVGWLHGFGTQTVPGPW